MADMIHFFADYALPLDKGSPEIDEIWATQKVVLRLDAVQMAVTAPVKIKKKGELTWFNQLALRLTTGPAFYISEVTDFSEVLDAIARED